MDKPSPAFEALREALERGTAGSPRPKSPLDALMQAMDGSASKNALAGVIADVKAGAARLAKTLAENAEGLSALTCQMLAVSAGAAQEAPDVFLRRLLEEDQKRRRDKATTSPAETGVLKLEISTLDIRKPVRELPGLSLAVAAEPVYVKLDNGELLRVGMVERVTCMLDE